MDKIFACYSCLVAGINMSTTATVVDGVCDMSPHPCKNTRCPYHSSKQKENIRQSNEEKDI